MITRMHLPMMPPPLLSKQNLVAQQRRGWGNPVAADPYGRRKVPASNDLCASAFSGVCVAAGPRRLVSGYLATKTSEFPARDYKRFSVKPWVVSSNCHVFIAD